MPRFEPFPGLRYSLSHVRSLDDVVCPPYDVISDAERLTLLQRSPSNIVRVELPDDEGAGDPYEGAARLLSAWRDGGVLGRDPVAAFYGHRMSFTDDAGQARQSVGVIGALGLEPPGHGVLPHEETTPKAKSDRLQLLRATRANTSPIWALAAAPGLAALCEPPPHPAEHAVDNDHVRHECWPITDPERIAAIAECVGSQPVLIADGHHRYETAVTYQAECQRRARPAPEATGTAPVRGDHDLVMALVVELSEEHLTVQAIHRLLSGLPAGFDIRGALAEWFELVPTDPPDRTIASRMVAAGGLAVVTTAGTWLARPNSEVSRRATYDLDSSRLDVARAGLPPHEVTYQHGWDRCLAAVHSGEADAAVLLRPATVEQIAATGRGGVRMPPKTTFFWPKPRTGMVLRELID